MHQVVSNPKASQACVCPDGHPLSPALLLNQPLAADALQPPLAQYPAPGLSHHRHAARCWLLVVVVVVVVAPALLLLLLLLLWQRWLEVRLCLQIRCMRHLLLTVVLSLHVVLLYQQRLKSALRLRPQLWALRHSALPAAAAAPAVVAAELGAGPPASPTELRRRQRWCDQAQSPACSESCPLFA